MQLCAVITDSLMQFNSKRHQKLVFRTNLYKLREEREINPRVFSNLVASTLYEKRFGPYFSEPVIAGIYFMKGKRVKTNKSGNNQT